MEDLDFGESLPKFNFNIKKIGTVVVALVVVLALIYLALGAVTQAPVSMQFEEPRIKAGESTVLKVVIVNTGEEDAVGVNVLLTASSAVLNVTNPSRTETIIGSRAKRAFEFTVSVNAGATPGTYKLTSIVQNIGDEEQRATAYLEVE